MAGGTWLSQNKVRPGAYINFKGVSESSSAVGASGIMTMPLPMSWGAQVTELLSTELQSGASLVKIGYTANDDEAQLYREALKNCYKAIIYRLDTGGTKAEKAFGNLTATAKYAGVVGNRISVAVIANGTKFDVVTYVDGAQKDRQYALELASDVVDNDWVDFSGTLALTAQAGANLIGGLDGSVTDANYTAYLTAIKTYQWDTMGIPVDNDTVAAAVVSAITEMRDTYGKKVRAVLYDYAADYEGIIVVDQGYKTSSETVAATSFVAYVAGLCAGSGIATSNTYHVIPGATEIVNAKTDAEIEAALAIGKIVLSSRQDGAIVIEQDINTLHTFTVDKPYSFSKNRVIRTLDEINNRIALLFATTFIGKVNNTADGRNVFKAGVISYMNSVQAQGSIRDFDSTADIAISVGEAIDAVVVDLAVTPVDSIEKVYMTVYVG